ncbi:MAG: ThiF family adenylyltransferase [Phycisphaerales bacterium]
MTGNRFDRQMLLFGAEGQSRLRAAKVAVIGAGGTGCFIIAQLALLGVGELVSVDADQADITTRNRHLCVRHGDPIPGTFKVDTAARMVREFDPDIRFSPVPLSLMTPEGFDAVKSADYVFGCVDREGVRLVLTELCAAYAKPYIDVATGVEPGNPPQYGGTVCCSIAGGGCLVCMGELDVEEAVRDLETPDQQRDREAIYGVAASALGGRGPSVVSINGVVSSLAVTEFMKLCTGLDMPVPLLRYDGRAARVSIRTQGPKPDCYYCKAVRGSGSGADVARYLLKPRR